ncbi:family 20 glycosylhydrolase [Cellulophaga baltica]|uniref:beta-N-acetylhexosaminidase n=1 Tax=Cellulophaga TaxID=104264 RepID=UPI001C078731|nr:MULTISPECIES: family 20 glycosylhydrolase [Cellulophaga]MBU2997972.1 family 20 glycosylhydrolase [Cellulophaga baltica]MDO6769373.1 family 20 glycosylhydrolase [Cellulophaga sp. 1_MG-2023]
MINLYKSNVIKFLLGLCSVFILFSCTSGLQTSEVDIIPMPTEVIPGHGYFDLNRKTIISVENNEQLKIANNFFSNFKKASGWTPRIGIKSSKATIEFKTENTIEDEGYEIIVGKTHVDVKASSGAGFFYALQSFAQVLPIEFYAQEIQKNIEWHIPVISIKDAPAFKWRGYMLDVSRHFFDKDQVKEVIDFMAEAKLNRFHWHLSDDNGWRVEIKKYPKLTEIGAWRLNRNAKDDTTSNWWGRPKQKEGQQATYGGFYTQEDIKEIVAYAKERYIEVIPELDMPGHSLAAIASYPELSCAEGPFYVGTGGVNKNNTYCPSNEKTYEFIGDVLNEVSSLFPFDYIHLGGDECNTSSWEKDPKCKKMIKDKNFESSHDLQGYFTNRVEKIVNSHDKKMIGWDEILESDIEPSATVMSWRGEKGGIKAAKTGHDVIMSPAKYCYLDLKQGDDDLEPNLGYAYSFLKDTYNYKVISDSLTTEEGEHILGLQGNLWTESITNWDQLTYMTFPRLYAIAENGWTQPKSKNWDCFTDRLIVQNKRLDKKGVNYATSAFNVVIDHEGYKEGNVDVTLHTEVNDLDIYYTTDGSIPTQKSKKYTNPFILTETSILKASSFKEKEQVSNVSEKYFPIHKAAGAMVIDYSTNVKETNMSGLVDLNYGKLNRGDKNWNKFHGDLNVDIIFPEEQEISSLEITSLRFTIGGIYVPENYEICSSEDGVNFEKISDIKLLGISHTQGRNKIKTVIDFEPRRAKAIKLKAKSVNPIPEEHHQEGKASKIFIDEVVVF